MKFCVIGLGRLGYHVATGLAQNGMEVMAIDSNAAIVASIRDKVTQAICMRVTDEESLRSVDIEQIDTVIVAMGENFAQSILVTALLKKRLGTERVITRAINEIHKDILKLIGADQVVMPEKEVGIRLADNLSLPFHDVIRLTSDFSICVIPTPKPFINQKIADLHLYDNYRLRCFGIQKNEEVEPADPQYIIQPNDKLIFSGLNNDLIKITKI